MGKYFGTDGVRGVANQELTPELAFKLGRYGGYVLAHNKGEKHPRVLVGRDTRVSGEMLESALIAGLISIGAEVMRLGIISTPGVAYLTRDMGAELGVMISASQIMVLNSLDQMVLNYQMNKKMKLKHYWIKKTQNYQDQLAMILYIIQITLKGHKNI